MHRKKMKMRRMMGMRRPRLITKKMNKLKKLKLTVIQTL
jgi:hypothetical protein